MTLDELVKKYVKDYTGSELSPGCFSLILYSFAGKLKELNYPTEEDVEKNSNNEEEDSDEDVSTGMGT
jgi:hypothetical protein